MKGMLKRESKNASTTSTLNKITYITREKSIKKEWLSIALKWEWKRGALKNDSMGNLNKETFQSTLSHRDC